MSVPSNISKGYFDFIKAIGDAKTKQVCFSPLPSPRLSYPPSLGRR